MQDIVKMQPNENADNYRIRLYRNQQLYSLSNKEIGKLCNEALGTKYDESAHRKYARPYIKGYEAGKLENLNTSNKKELEDLEQAKIELKAEKIALSDIRNKYTKEIRNWSRIESFRETMVSSIENLEKFNMPKVKINTANCKIGLLGLADLHYGLDDKIYDLFGNTINEYNEQTFMDRMWKLRDEILEISQKEGINKLHIVALGDMLHGLIRLSALQSLEYGLIDTVMRLAEFLSAWINELSKSLFIEFHTVTGNHSELRVCSLKSGELPNENLERLIAWYIKGRLKGNQNIKIHEAKKAELIQIFDLNILAIHGQNERNLEQSLKDFRLMYKTDINILLSGHLHTSNSKTIGFDEYGAIEFIQFGSICGIEQYSVKLRKSSPAGTSFVVLEDKSRKRIKYEINLQ